MSLKKQIRKIDTNLFSGSSDTLRTAMGVYYKITSSFDENNNNIGTVISSSEPVDPNLGSVRYSEVSSYELPNSDVLKFSQLSKTRSRQTNSGPITRFRFPIRIAGEESKITNSTEWATMLLGGIFGSASYGQMFTANTYDVYNHNYDTSYTELQKKQILNLATNQSLNLSTFNIGYDYQLYLPQYQNMISSKVERELPSMYFNEIYSQGKNSGLEGLAVNDEINKFVTRNGSYDYTTYDLHADRDLQLSETPPPYRLEIASSIRNTDNSKYEDMSLFLRQYLTGAFLSDNISEETLTNLINKSQTLYYTKQSNEKVIQELQEDRGRDIYKRYPMQANLKIPVIPPNFLTSSYYTFITDNDLEEEVLSYIKSTFVGGGNLSGTPTTIEFARELTQMIPRVEEGKIAQSIETSTITDNAIDVPEMLLQIAQNPDITQTQEELFITPDADEVHAMKNANSSFRYTKTINGMQALQSTLRQLNSNFDVNIREPIAATRGDNFAHLLENIKNLVNVPEVLAYRIEKIGGPPIGDSQQRQKIQDIFLFNNGLAFDESLQYYDTQVKYGEEYTYSVYAYMLVEGVKYKYSDLRISRYTGEALKVVAGDASEFVLDDEPYCLEFYDPLSGQAADQLLNSKSNLLSNTPTFPTVTVPMIRAYYEASTAAAKRSSSGRFTQIAVFNVWLGEREDGNSEAQDAYDYIFNGHPSQQYERFLVQFRNFSLKHHEYYLENDITYGSGDDNVIVQGGQTIKFAIFDSNMYATNAHIKSANKYLADFHFEIEPTLKLIQVPIVSKYFTVLDNPPVACDIVPYQRKDNSQIIGFQINRETFPINKNNTKIFNNKSNFGLYPTPISPEEQQLKTTYLNSNNMLPNEIVTKPSISPPDRVDVYRLSEMPTSLNDFNNNVVFSVGLQYEDDIYQNYSNCFYEESIATNQKFYYLFKFVNENGMPGYVSPIQVVELVDDGGYKYAKFDVLFEEQLEIANPQQPSYDFKKLIQIVPSIRHTEINEQGLDQNMDPHQLINDDEIQVGYASDPIWNKKFKFRLTSKKTGRKVDFNITYKLRNS